MMLHDPASCRPAADEPFELGNLIFSKITLTSSLSRSWLRKISMAQIEVAARRSRGRPSVRSDEETRHIIADAAQREFLANGYVGACVDDIAKSAGVSKKTLYRLIPTKADLFRVSAIDGIASFMLAIDEGSRVSHAVSIALERLLTEYGNLTLSAETIAIQKLAIAETDRFPEL